MLTYLWSIETKREYWLTPSGTCGLASRLIETFTCSQLNDLQSICSRPTVAIINANKMCSFIFHLIMDKLSTKNSVCSFYENTQVWNIYSDLSLSLNLSQQWFCKWAFTKHTNGSNYGTVFLMWSRTWTVFETCQLKLLFLVILTQGWFMDCCCGWTCDCIL